MWIGLACDTERSRETRVLRHFLDSMRSGVDRRKHCSARIFQSIDLQSIVSVSDPQISPDGKQVAIIVSTHDWKSDQTRDEIDLVDVASSARRVLARNRKKLSSPRWSPDGTHLAFLARDTKTNQPQVFVMPMTGGDALRVPGNRQGVDNYSWSPDGKTIAFIAQDPPLNAAAIKAHNKVFKVTDGHFLLTREVAPWQLWVVTSSGGTAKRLTAGTFSLGTDQGGVTTPACSRDGKRIAFTKFPSAYWAPSFRSVIAEVQVTSGTP